MVSSRKSCFIRFFYWPEYWKRLALFPHKLSRHRTSIPKKWNIERNCLQQKWCNGTAWSHGCEMLFVVFWLWSGWWLLSLVQLLRTLKWWFCILPFVVCSCIPLMLCGRKKRTRGKNAKVSANGRFLTTKKVAVVLPSTTCEDYSIGTPW